MHIKKLFRSGFISVMCSMAFAYQASAQCGIPISVFPYYEAFELGDGNWFHGGTATDWAYGTPSKPVITAAAGGTKCWLTGGLSGSSYNNGENSWLQSPCFDFSSLVNPQISFSVFWETEKRFDGANMEYSIDGGTSWILIGSVNDNGCIASNWYNTPSVNFLGGANGWSGNIQPTVGSCQGGSGSNGWLVAMHDLSFLAGAPNVIFRFRFGAGTTCNGYDGFAIDEVRITEAPPNSGDFTYTCNGNRDVTFTAATTGCPTTYTWDFGDPVSGVNNVSTIAAPSHTFSAAGSYTVNLVITFATGPQVLATHTPVILDVNITQSIPVSCNSIQDATIAAFVTGGSGTYNYSWNTVPPQTTFNLQNIGAGNYTVMISSLGACNTSASFIVTEPAALSAAVVTTAASCGNNNGSITAAGAGGTPPYQYNWSNGGTTAMISNLPPGNYSLTVKDANNCSIVKNNIVVADNAIPVAVFLGNDTSVCKGETVLLDPGVFSSYRWQDNSSNQTFTVTGTGKYWVRLTDGSGCSGSDTINVVVDCSGLYFPSAFTPNQDTWNDQFGPLGNLGSVRNYIFRVYDRYGQIIFYSTDPYKKWDGTLKGGGYNTGAFTWFVTYNIVGQPPKTQKGTVLLLR